MHLWYLRPRCINSPGGVAVVSQTLLLHLPPVPDDVPSFVGSGAGAGQLPPEHGPRVWQSGAAGHNTPSQGSGVWGATEPEGQKHRCVQVGYTEPKVTAVLNQIWYKPFWRQRYQSAAQRRLYCLTWLPESENCKLRSMPNSLRPAKSGPSHLVGRVPPVTHMYRPQFHHMLSTRSSMPGCAGDAGTGGTSRDARRCCKKT